ncbi:MAG: DUF5335 family protein [Pyrinomonadaceae bacterium]
MATQEITQEDWPTFFNRFSRQHEGWLATLEVFGAEFGAQRQARELPFEGISLTSQQSGAETITVNLGKTSDDHLSHTIGVPTRVWLQQTSEGANAALEIESADGAKTLLRFRSALLPEMVDGIVRD